MEEQENIQLLQNIALGSRHSFDQFYERYIAFVYQIAFSIVHDHTEAEDVCHDVFLEVLQKASQYSPAKGSIKAWLAVKTKSRSIDRLRKNKPLLINRLEVFANSTEVVQGADIHVLHQLETHIIMDALNEIPLEQREAIIRSYFLGETQKEIAFTMRKPLGSVKSLIRYGLNNLRKQQSLINWVESSRGENK